MSNPVQTKKLSFTDVKDNNNKTYIVTLYDDGEIVAEWGRTGRDKLNVTRYTGGQCKFDSIVREKLRKGYTEPPVMEEGISHSPAGINRSEALRRASLAKLTSDDFRSDSRVENLVSRIVQTNAHAIATTSGGQITVTDNQVRTPLGLILPSGLDEAKNLIDRMEREIDADTRVDLLNNYLRIIPQKVPAKRGWEHNFLNPTALEHQREFVEQLRGSLDFISVSNDVDVDFSYELAPIDTDDQRFQMVAKDFTKTLNRTHMAANYKLTGLYAMTGTKGQGELFEAARQRVGNVRWMWHGTMVSNVLSILAKGLFCPPENSPHATGRMFGNGIYLSEQSTKSLNYSGGFWSGRRMAPKAYMFRAEVAMGKSYHPTRSRRLGEDFSHLTKGYDSVDVKAGTAGVLNHEAVVWNTDQLNLRYICEFTAK